MAKVTITNGEKKGSEFGVQVHVNGATDTLLAPGVSVTKAVSLSEVLTLSEVKLQKVKTK